MKLTKRRVVLFSSILLLCLLATAIFVGQRYVRGLGPRARQRVISDLSDRFDADVKLQSLELALLPTPRIVGTGLEIWRRRYPSRQPFLKIGRFVATATASDLFYQRDRVGEVDVEGLRIDLPPRNQEAEQTDTNAQGKQGNNVLRVVIERLVANGAVLQIEPKTPDKPPLEFNIQKLTMLSVGPGQPLTFFTVLQNAKPPGLIDSTGSFGPWNRDDLRATPVKGSYKFTNADLSVFGGISGTLASTGSYKGRLDDISVDGSTDVPNFALRRGGAPVHLTTNFEAIVDGSNGNTVLQRVKAHFLHSNFICSGGVQAKRPHTGKTVQLEGKTAGARIEDILVLVSGDNRPLLDGNVQFQSAIVIPPGQQDVLNRLMLKGDFSLHQGVFADPKIEHRLKTLSDRAQGITKQDEEAHYSSPLVASGLNGSFALQDGTVAFSHLTFQVPGAAIKLAGSYNLNDEKIDMNGVFRMQATLAQTQSGMKHWLLMPLDPLFEKNGAGFQVPLSISGTRSQPEITVLAFRHRFRLK